MDLFGDRLLQGELPMPAGASLTVFLILLVSEFSIFLASLLAFFFGTLLLLRIV